MNNFMHKITAQFGYKPETIISTVKSYKKQPSISEKLMWTEYDSKSKTFPLADGRSYAALFELGDVPSEARPDEYLLQLQQGLQGLFQDVFPSYFDDEGPWVVQFYLQDELTFQNYFQSCLDYVKPSAKESVFSKNYFKVFEEHTKFMAQANGIFVDNKVSGNVFRGKIRKIRAVIYRRINSKAKLRKGRTVLEDLNIVAESFISKLEGSGVKAKRLEGKDFYRWMVSWFNPSPRGYKSTDDLLNNCPYPGDDEMPFGYDFSERFFFSTPESRKECGVWYFDKLPHKFVTIAGLNSIPRTGHLSVERKFGNNYYALFDKFPEGSVFVLTVIIQTQEHVKNHIFKIENSTKRSRNTNAEMAREDCALAKREIESGNFLFPCVMGVYLKGNDLQDLYAKETQIETLLSNNGLVIVDGDNDLTPIDSYLRYLPMCYSYQFDKTWMYRSRYLFGKQLAKLLPLYGRERGTGHPGIPLYNRCGEPFTLDPLNPEDKDNNSHLLLLGSTGAGKSATCVYLMMHMMATYRPRLVVVEAGNSFGPLSDYCKSHGLSVNRVEISLVDPPILNPFADSEKMLSQIETKNNLEFKSVVENTEKEIDDELATRTKLANEKERNCEAENRDYLGEMALAAQLLITGGESKEEDKITRQDRMIIIDAIVRAAKKAKVDGRDQMIISDFVMAFRIISEEIAKKGKDVHKAGRIREMADSAEFFCKDHLSSLVFNRPGKSWIDADLTVFELGIFKDEGYEAHRALAFMGAMNQSMSLAEKNQYEERFTVFYGDEIHIITKNPLTAVYLTKCSKMSRKIGLWLWLATQNVHDFPDDARKMLSMIEFWLCLGMSEAEMAEVERFKPLTDEERSLFRSVRKASGKYVEGVVLCNRFKGLFRNIPPRIALALAMTEKHEKAERRELMKMYNCTEVEAAMMVAARMMGKLAG